MTATRNQEQSHVAARRKEQRDNSDGWDRGYSSPYPKDKEEIILANIAKVSPAFVQGYRQGKSQADSEDWLGTYDPDDYPDYNDPYR
jgi:hypothetical protein